MHFFEWLAKLMDDQYFVNDFFFHLSIRPVKNDCGTFMIGSGLMSGLLTPAFARLSAMSFPSMLLCPGTQVRVTLLLDASFWVSLL